MKKYTNKETAIEYIKTIILFIVTFLFIFIFVARSAVTDGVSMYDTLDHGDKIIVEKVSYYFRNPKVNDVVIFPYDQSLYIKRVIGVEGDIIDFKDGIMYLNGEKYSDEHSNVVEYVDDVDYPITVSKDKYFVLGDNRKVSHDSRFESVGLINKKDIVGKAFIKIYPLNEFKIVK